MRDALSQAGPGTGVACPFAHEALAGEALAGVEPAEVARLCDPGAAAESLHWGRNYLYRAHLAGPQGKCEVVVKQFREESLRARAARRRLGSKAERSFRNALALGVAGVPTPRPWFFAADRSGRASYYACEHLPGALELRYLLRAARAGQEREAFPHHDLDAILAELGRLARRMHDAGILHRDLSVGNVLLLPRPSGGHALWILDLNRARTGRVLSAWRRMRDLARLALDSPRLETPLLRGYWGAEPSEAQRRSFRWAQGSFELKNHLKRPWRSLRGWLAGLGPRRAHAHIPAAPAGAGPRDRVVWDHLSDQPHQHAGRWEKLAVRLADLPAHGVELANLAIAAPRIARRYRQLRHELYREPVRWGGVGLGLRPLPEAPEVPLTAVAETGVRHVLLRLHPWEEDHRAELELARELHARGLEVAFALPQNRQLVREPARWRTAVGELAELFAPFGTAFQVGQAVNRSKWGVWRRQEYVALAVAAREEILARCPHAQIFGPAVIDFELHVTAAVVNLQAPGYRLDGVSGLLYVDRRGAPENPQLGFDTVAKVVLQKAIADTARSAGAHSWITEVNWPLWEGPHSPAGKGVAVHPEEQADYLVRYYLLALATGLVERVYWWQAIARGYGLAYLGEDGALVRRPAWSALATLERELAGASSLGPLPAAAGGRLYAFRGRAGADLVVGWATGRAPVEVDLGRTVARLVARDGAELAVPAASRVRLTASPVYFWLAP